jgi:acetoin utilization protein AcuA
MTLNIQNQPQSEKNDLVIEPEGQLLEPLTKQTDRGAIYFRRRVPASRLEKMRLAEGLGIFFRYDLERQKNTLLKIVRMEYGNVVIAHTADDLILGYVSMHSVDESERWAVLNKPGEPLRVYEFGAIEVSRKWRGYGLSTALMRAAIEGDSWMDDKIIVSVEFAWHWDNEEMGLSKFAYREILRKVIATGGFQKMDTDEPNVMMDSANMFMVRVGKKVPVEIEQQFYSLLHTHNKWGL